MDMVTAAMVLAIVDRIGVVMLAKFPSALNIATIMESA